MSRQFLLKSIIHIIPWIILIVGPFSGLLLNSELESVYKHRALFVLVLLISGFYLNYFVIIPRFLFKQKWFHFSVSIFTLILVVAFLNQVMHRFLFPVEMDPLIYNPVYNGHRPNVHVMMFPNAFPPVAMFLLITLGVAFRVTNRWMEQDSLRQEISKEQMQTELAFLKNQISPHFFFNTLNNIYALTEYDPSQARDTTYKLSKLMRYLLYESESRETVTLGREITFLKTFIDLMKVRLPENVVVNFNHGSEDDNTEIPPLLFVSFVENAFKHGISYQENCSMDVSLSRVDDQIIFSCINLIPMKANSNDYSGGLGLQNVRRRLELLYSEGQYDLNINESSNMFEVQLKIYSKND